MEDTDTPDFSRAQYTPAEAPQPARPPVPPEWYSATGALVAINVIVFLLMVLADRAALMNPSHEQLIRWGADFGPLTLNNQFWRLVTSGFLHIGLLHIAVNMWSLWIVGRMTERFVGPSSLVAIYLLTGMGASMASLAWNPLRVSAGASGPIFGCVGTIMGIVFFAKGRIPPLERKNLLSWAVRVAAINLFIGLSAGIDNMAHFGGLMTGAVIGAALIFSTKAEPSNRANIRWMIFVALFLVLGFLFVPLRAAKRDLLLAYQGEVALEGKDYSTAIARFHESVGLAPDDASLHARLGLAYQLASKPNEAMAEYERTLALNDEEPEVKINLASLYKESGKTREAIGLFTQSIEKVKPDSEAYKEFGEALLADGQFEQAESQLRTAIRLDGNDAQAHEDLAQALNHLGKSGEAQQQIKTAADLRAKEPQDSDKKVKP